MHFFINANQSPQTIDKENQLYYHLTKVMRVKNGQQIELVLNDQTIDLVEIANITKNEIELKLIRNYLKQVELPIDVTIVISPLKNDRIEWLLQKATELGVNRIIIIDLKNSVVLAKRIENKLERYSKIIQSAAEQSQRNAIPVIEFSNFKDLPKADMQLIANENYASKKTASLSKILKTNSDSKNLIAIFGPEGGFDSDEIEYLEQRGYQSINLGPRILRAETAPLYLLSVISSLVE